MNLYIFVGLALLGYSQNALAMEIIFGRKYPIQQKAGTNELSWLSVQFEKDLTGKVIYRLEASHPTGRKISYLKGRDYLLSEDIQNNMIRNFEVKMPEVEFGPTQRAIFEVALPYDFKTRYLPLKVETDKGYQEVVLRLRFGDYRFMLASRVLNNVLFQEAEPVIAAKTVDQLFAKREQLKKRPPKLIAKPEVREVKVDEIYDVISKDLNIQTRIITDEQKALALDTPDPVNDDFDSILSKYAIDEEKAKAAVDPAQGLKINPEQLNAVTSNPSYNNELDTSGLTPEQQEVLNNPTTESDYNEYVENMVKEKDNDGFDAEASIDEIISQAGQFDRADQAADIANSNDEMETEDNESENLESNESYDQDLSSEASSLAEDSESQASKDLAELDQLLNQETEEVKPVVKPKPKPVVVAPVDTEELFGLPADDWIEPKSAPVLVIAPKPVDQKRRIASFEKPKRNNFVEMAFPPKPEPSKGVNMDDLFGGDTEANPSGFGF